MICPGGVNGAAVRIHTGGEFSPFSLFFPASLSPADKVIS